MALAHLRPCILAALAFTAPALAADWPQLQNGPARLGYSAEKIDVPLTRAWAVGMAPERLHPQAQPIVAGGKVLIGTEMGNFHAFDARTGKRAWTYKAGGAVLHTAGAEGGMVFFACLDGCVYALALDDGALRWRFDSKMRTGFSTAVLLADGNVYAANRGGTCFALRQAGGSLLWRRDVGAAVLMSPALAAGGPATAGGSGDTLAASKRVVFGAMDMRVYALDAKTGEVAWRSDVLPGAAFKDYWPVAYKDCVIVRPQKAAGGATGPAIEWLSGPLPQTELDKQQALVDRLGKDPAQGDLFVLDARTGRLAPPVPHWTSCTMNGAVAPPCVDGDGLLIVPVMLHDWRGGWGRLDLDKRRVVEVLAEAGTDPRGQKRGMGNSDENLLPAAAGRVVFAFHTEEGNANFTGVWHLDRRDWTQVGPIHAEQCFASNTQGGGGNPVSIAGGMVYHTSWNTLNARVAGPARDASSR